MRFESEGQFEVEIIEAYMAEARFTPGALDVALHVRTMDGKYEDFWLGELSDRYGVGNASDKQQCELTLASLERIGWEHGQNICDETLASLVGVKTEVGVVSSESSNGRTFYNVRYLGQSNFGPKRVSAADAKAKVAALFGANATSSAPASAAPAEPVDDGANPFL